MHFPSVSSITRINAGFSVDKTRVGEHSAAGVEAVVDGLEALSVHMGVDLGGGDVRVA